MDGIKDLKNLALEEVEKRSSLLKNEKYILWKIKKNWKLKLKNLPSLLKRG